MATDVAWYNLDVATDRELRTLLTHRHNLAETALATLSTASLDYINNFKTYVTLNDPIYCRDLFQEQLPYVIGTIVGQGKVGQVALLSRKTDISVVAPDISSKKTDTVDPTSALNLIIKTIAAVSVGYLSIRILDHPGADVNPWNNYWKIYGQDNRRKIVAVGGNNFANQTSIHLILNLILGNNPHYIHQYDAFYCNNLGYNIIEYSNSGDLHAFLEGNQVNDEILFTALSHVLAPLSILKHPRYNFNHSDLKAKNVFVHQGPQGYVFKIADYDKSSITWNGYRFYNWSHHYTPTAGPILLNPDKSTYTLTSMLNLQLQTMHNPYSIPMSYDLYTFVLSLFGSKNVWTQYVSSALPRFQALMHQLFPKELYYIILGKIALNPQAMVSLSNINKLLNGVLLQYDLSYVYELLGFVPPPLTISEAEQISIVVSQDGHLCSADCQINPDINPTYSTCPTNTYSKTRLSTTLYNWDYCQDTITTTTTPTPTNSP